MHFQWLCSLLFVFPYCLSYFDVPYQCSCLVSFHIYSQPYASQLRCFIVPENTFIIIRVYIQICGLGNIVITLMQYVPFPESLPLLSFWLSCVSTPQCWKQLSATSPDKVLLQSWACFLAPEDLHENPILLVRWVHSVCNICIIFLSVLRCTWYRC